MHFRLTALALSLALATSASALTVTIDLNGFPNATGGHVANAAGTYNTKFEPGGKELKLEGLEAGGTYSVDFYHNSGETSSDFSFTVNEAGTGVASVTKSGADRFEIVEGFKPGDATLKLKTFTVTYNPGRSQTGNYYIAGIHGAHTLGDNSDPQVFKALPGDYRVDNLYNTGMGNEDYAFVVDDKGKAAPIGGSEEYLEIEDASVKPRSAVVHYKIEASAPVNFHASHPSGSVTTPPAGGNVYEVDIKVPVGSTGLNVWSFGKSEVTGGDMTKPDDGKTAVGEARENDFIFNPRLRYDAKSGFFFETTRGPAKSVTAEATGAADDGSPLTAKVTATLIEAQTRPAE